MNVELETEVSRQTRRPPTTRVKPTAPELENDVLQNRMRDIRHKIVVMSGKGGVGKSTLAANLALMLATTGRRVGLLDVDVHGPSIPKLMGIEGQEVTAEHARIHPVSVGEHLSVMSVGFFLGSAREAVIWRGPLKYKLIQQFLQDVIWGELDYLVVDSPPGTGDEPLTVAQLVGQAAEALIVTTPQDISLADVRRSITFCREVSLPVLGLVENMSGLVCPQCGGNIELFKVGGGEGLAQEMGIPFLGRIPIDPGVVHSSDAGTPFAQHYTESQAAKALDQVLGEIIQRHGVETIESLQSALTH